ncbi:hypothetical protein AAVH_17276 [Aphelenchoides avenae]|nr:hypothetical protein AAVH_17276 [Aphelenchus avenae]
MHEDPHPPDFEFWLRHSDPDAILRLLKHTSIRVLRFTAVDSAFLQHFIEKAQDVDIVVGLIRFIMPIEPTSDDYALRDSIVDLLRPQYIETEGEKRGYF